MQRKLTITIDEKTYEGLQRVAGRRKISQFIENLVRPHIMDEQEKAARLKELEEGYRQMAADEEREAEAREWIEGLIGDVRDEER